MHPTRRLDPTHILWLYATAERTLFHDEISNTLRVILAAYVSADALLVVVANCFYRLTYSLCFACDHTLYGHI